MEVIAGAAGQAFATEFIGFLNVYRQLPTIDQILIDPTHAPVPSNPSALFALATALVRPFTKANAFKSFTYAARMPKEFEIDGMASVLV